MMQPASSPLGQNFDFLDLSPGRYYFKHVQHSPVRSSTPDTRSYYWKITSQTWAEYNRWEGQMVSYEKRVKCEFDFVDSGFRRIWCSSAHVWLLLLFTTVIEKGKPETQKATSTSSPPSLPGTHRRRILRRFPPSHL